MRMRRALATGLAAAVITPAAVLAALPAALPGQASAAAAPAPPLPSASTPSTSPEPFCGNARAQGLPIGTRIEGGPASYRAGSASGAFSVVLTNTTAQPCVHIYPVVVLTGRDHPLTPARIRMEFLDEGRGTWRPVTFVATDEGEAVGAFGGAKGTGKVLAAGEFEGFVIPARGSVTVSVRLAFPAGDTPADAVVANAAVVQRRGADGDWVGESADYRFSLLASDESLFQTPLRTPFEATPSAGTGIDPNELAQTGNRADIGVMAAIAALLTAAGMLLTGAHQVRTGRH
ncbi:hypothetical protein ABZ532_22675 [Streptomyces sp. NPDC019396]|uniref:hypothetical protein n=1 Tax=Streptomyces sp. NPDC019396 TaxID=3154687 RepID=UPI0033F38E05